MLGKPMGSLLSRCVSKFYYERALDIHPGDIKLLPRLFHDAMVAF